MNRKKAQSDISAADKTGIGFDFQYFFFLWKLLSLKDGESVGLEMKDDVHTELNNNEQILYQVKHTIQKKKDGTPKNLTTLDKDLWKTISNWVKIITDEADERGKKAQQIKFLKKTSFVLASNKSYTGKNEFLKCIDDFQNQEITIPEVISSIKKLSGKTEDKDIETYINTLKVLDNQILGLFLMNIVFELDDKDIIQKCKKAIKSDKIPGNQIDDVFQKVDSAIRVDNFITIKTGKKVEIKFDDFYRKYRRYYDLARSSFLKIRSFKGKLPNKLEDQIFIKQILEIGDVNPEDIETIAEYTRFKLKLANNIIEWRRQGELTREEIERLEDDAINQWTLEHRKQYRGKIEESKFNAIGLKIIDSIREKKLKVANQDLETDMCNGQFYDLSDIPKIGWRHDWEKYKK